MMKKLKVKIIFFVCLKAFWGSLVFATQESPQSFTFQGRLLNSAGTDPLEEPVSLKFQIFDPSANCLLYQETQNIDLTNTSGAFSLTVGSAQAAAKRTAGVDPGIAMAKIFKNDPLIITRPVHADCPNGYTPTAGDFRLLRVTVTPSSTGIPEVLTPDQTINSVPQALIAETLQGIGPSEFIKKDPIYINDINVDKLFGSQDNGVVDATDLHTHDDRYIQISSSSSQNLGSGGFNTSGKASVGNSTNFINTTFSLKSLSDTEIGLAIRAGSETQSADLLQVQNIDGVSLAGISSRGELSAVTSTLTSTSGNQLVVKYDNINNSTLDVSSNGTSTFTAAGISPKFNFAGGNVGIGTSSPVSLLQTQNGMFTMSDTNVEHPIPSGWLGFGEQSSFFGLRTLSGTNGGARIQSVSDTDATALQIDSYIGSSDPTDSTPAMVFRSNKWNGATGTTSLSASETAFQFKNANSTLATILGNGNVGFGISSPNTTLDVSGTFHVGTTPTSGLSFTPANDRLSISSNATLEKSGASLLIGRTSYSTQILYTSNLERVRIDSVGRVGIGVSAPSEMLHVSGNILASGTITPSDRKLKKNIRSVENALEKIISLEGVTYDWKDPKKSDQPRQMGVIAQDVQKVFPEAVINTNDGFLAVSYSVLVAPLIESVKLLFERKAEKVELEKIKVENAMMKSYLCKKDPSAPFCK